MLLAGTKIPSVCRKPKAGSHGEHIRYSLPQASLLSLFLSHKPAEGKACPFTKAQAYHSHCFKKNFLALSLKLKLPLGALLFCMFLPLLVVAIPPFCSSSTVTLRRAQRALAGPPFPHLNRAGQVCPRISSMS